MQAAASWASGRRARRAMRPRCWRHRARAWPHDTISVALLRHGWPTGLRAGTFRRWTACGGMRWAASLLLVQSTLPRMPGIIWLPTHMLLKVMGPAKQKQGKLLARVCAHQFLMRSSRKATCSLHFQRERRGRDLP